MIEDRKDLRQASLGLPMALRDEGMLRSLYAGSACPAKAVAAMEMDLAATLPVADLGDGLMQQCRPLPVSVVVTRPPAGQVPTTATSPSPARVVTEGGTKSVGDELVLLVDDDAADPDAVALAAAKAAGGAVNEDRGKGLRFDPRREPWAGARHARQPASLHDRRG
jgi:hypothetical protein